MCFLKAKAVDDMIGFSDKILNVTHVEEEYKEVCFGFYVCASAFILGAKYGDQE